MTRHSEDCDVAIVGAGPYGLAAAAHLHKGKGLDVRVFGRPMDFWERQMPVGMLLRSPYVASNIADPERSLTLDAYGSANGGRVPKPVPLGQFVSYGRWFRGEVVSHLDSRFVSRIDNGNGFTLELEDGEAVRARRVVVAAGIGPFAHVPPEFEHLPSELASHASVHRELTPFAGKRVAVIGGGQSALESAALLHEAGAEVEVLVRAPRIYYLRRVPRLHRLGPLTKLLFAPAEVGPVGVSRLVSAPGLYRRFPRGLQDKMSVRSLRPAGASWLVDRLAGVPISIGRAVVSAAARDNSVELSLDDGSRRQIDHALLATGYRVDIARYPFLAGALLERIARVGGFPRLSTKFESSVTGLHFVGATSAWSYGPLMRFVAGTEFAGPVLARGILGRRAGRG
ncbi:MAG TPA: FAD-dependent oxidoreductase [Gaiellaceae bacterium]|nr:FAD-dependent oxidoreductase [Gaiellaceae bacterium]